MSMGSGSIDSCLSFFYGYSNCIYPHAATCGEEGLGLVEKEAMTFL